MPIGRPRVGPVSCAGRPGGLGLGRALMLNASFEPLCVVSARRAVVLVLKEKAEIVHRNGAEFRAERVTVPVPSVIRLRHYVRVPYRSVVPLSRRAVFARRAPLPVLRPAGREPRSRPAPLARWRARLGERGRVVPRLQRPEGRPAPPRVRPRPPARARDAARDGLARRRRRPRRPLVARVPRPVR